MCKSNIVPFYNGRLRNWLCCRDLKTHGGGEIPSQPTTNTKCLRFLPTRSERPRVSKARFTFRKAFGSEAVTKPR